MFYTSTLSPGEIHLARALIEGKIDREPDVHLFYDHHVDWFTVSDGLKRYNSDSPELEKYRQIKT